MSTAIAERGPFSLLLDLENEGKLTPQALVLSEEIPYDTFEALCRYLGAMSDSSNWWLGDLFVYGERVFGDLVYQAFEASGKSNDMLQRCVTVSTRIPPGRRNPELSWSHHRDVAHLEPQEQKEWLDRAVAERWTRKELEANLRPKPEPPEHVPCPTCGGRGWLPE